MPPVYHLVKHPSDCTDPNQQVLFSPEPDYAYLKAMLQARFRNQTVTVADIENYVVAETPFHSSQYKTSVLKPMEAAGELAVTWAPPKRRAGTYKAPLMRVKIL